jgi:ABC-type sulfate transport system permease component
VLSTTIITFGAVVVLAGSGCATTRSTTWRIRLATSGYDVPGASRSE